MATLAPDAFDAKQALEGFKREWETRLGRGQTLPGSVAIFQHFYDVLPTKDPNRVRFEDPVENFNYFDLEDFVDYATSQRSPEFADPMRFADRVRYALQSSGPTEALSFSLPDGRFFSVTGAAIRRVGRNAVITVVGGIGRPGGVSGSTIDLSNGVQGAISNVPVRKEGDSKPVLVFGTELQRFVLGCCLNLGQGSYTLSGRQVSFDTDRAWTVINDNEEMTLEAFGAEGAKLHERSLRELERLDVLFQVALLFLHVPAYYDYRIDWVCDDRIKNPGFQGKKSSKKGSSSQTDTKYVLVRSIRVLKEPHKEATGEHVYTPPAFQVEVGGFWRKLPQPWQVGKNQYGEPITGMTWVSQHIRHRDKPAPPKARVVYVKEQIRAADKFIESRRTEQIGR